MSGAPLAVGDEVLIRATQASGRASQANGHACKVGKVWYHIDELEVKPKVSDCPPLTCTAPPIRAGGPPPQRPGGYAGSEMKIGGWSNLREIWAKARRAEWVTLTHPFQEPSSEDLEVWSKVTTEVQKDLTSKGPPAKVESQVVAGMKYRFAFADGSSVVVLSVPWMNKVEVLEVS
ncbi:unnamed protein product [Durusdinium trenchii]|uniref:Cysteine proteinase inhibitor n=1 Tax=Durusdinium trenchii TaxID=1381693 RepID=A0ABP0I634_9DINO